MECCFVKVSPSLDKGGLEDETVFMPWRLRREYPGAIYQVMNRGDRRRKDANPVMTADCGLPKLKSKPHGRDERQRQKTGTDSLTLSRDGPAFGD
jgi:hypothetical protein